MGSGGKAGTAPLRLFGQGPGFIVPLSDDVLFAPSIDQLVFSDPTTLKLQGNFGRAQGSVMLTGQRASIKTWSWTLVSGLTTASFIQIDASQGSGGQLQVISADGIKSNTVNLTSWDGTFSLSANGDGSAADRFGNRWTQTFGAAGTFNVRLRGDVHSSRLMPGAAPRPVVFYPTFTTATSNAQVTASGSLAENTPDKPTMAFSSNAAPAALDTFPSASKTGFSLLEQAYVGCKNAGTPTFTSGSVDAECYAFGFSSPITATATRFGAPDPSGGPCGYTPMPTSFGEFLSKFDLVLNGRPPYTIVPGRFDFSNWQTVSIFFCSPVPIAEHVTYSFKAPLSPPDPNGGQ